MSRSRVLLAALCAACGAHVPLGLPEAPPPRTPSDHARWREPPPLAPEEALHVEWQIERQRLPSGLGLNVVSRPESKSTALLLWVPAAADASEGAVAVMAEALRAGTHARTGELLVNPRLARQPISIRTQATGTTLFWHVLPRATERALELLADFVARPAFDAAQTRVVLRQELARIARGSGGVWHLANLARDGVAGVDLPSPWSDAFGVLAATPERLRATHRCAMRAQGAELVVVGPGAAAELMAAALGAFSDFAPPPPAAGECATLPRPPWLGRGAPNAQVELQIVYGATFDPYVVIATPGPSPRSPDYLPFLLATQVLDSRDSGIRGLRHTGATYGIHASVNESFPGGTLLELSGQVAPERARAALRTLVQDLRGLHASLDARELAMVKRREKSAFVRALSDNLQLGAATLAQLRRGRPPDAVKRWPNELMAVSLESCRQAAARWLQHAQPSIAVTGVPVPLVRGLGLRANVRRLYWTDRLPDPKKAL